MGNLVAILFSCLFFGKMGFVKNIPLFEKNRKIVNTGSKQKNNKEFLYTVVIDPGHGGFDPGKVGVSNTLEKDVNLSIAKELRLYLQQKNINVYMTRDDDNALSDGLGGSKKSQDMRMRAAMMCSSGTSIAVSIHQNSFPAQSVNGCQVFYYQDSVEGKQLADLVSEKVRMEIPTMRQREPKPNRDYYILKKVTCPVVIVECGFLSCPEEEILLKEEWYQKQLAKGIGEGMMAYLGLYE